MPFNKRLKDVFLIRTKSKIMKYTLSLLLSAFLFISLNAQVSESNQTMSLGPKTSFSIDIDGADKKMTENTWKDYLKEYGKVEKNKKAKELYMTQVRVPLITGAGEVNLFSKVEEGKNMSTVYLWVDNGSSFVSSDEDEEAASGAIRFMKDFGNILTKKVIAEELKEEEKNLKNFNKDLGKLENKNKDLHEDIEKAKDKIREAEENIVKNLAEQDEKKAEIEAQSEKVSEVTKRLNNVGKE